MGFSPIGEREEEGVLTGSLKVHEMRMFERDSREEEQTLLFRAMSKFKKTKQEDGQTSRGRGKGRGRGRGRGRD